MVAYAAQQYEPQQKVLSDFSGGLNAEKPPSKLAENEFITIQNLQFYRGKLRPDTGYTTFGQVVNGEPQASFQFIKTDGSLQDLLLTTTTLYEFNTTALQWQLVEGGAATTLSAATLAGSNSFSFTSASGFTIGDLIGITLDDASQLQTTISNIVGTTITTADNVPVGRTAPSGANVVDAPKFSGSVDLQPVGLTWAPLNLFIFTNGVNAPQQYDGTQAKALIGVTFDSCRVLVAFHSFLIAFDVTQSGTRFPFRTQNSDAGNPQEWISGLAQITDLVDTEDFIMAAEPLGPWIIIYRQASIMRRSYIGNFPQIFFDEYMLQGVGVVSQNCIADTGSSHIFVGEEGIFRYSGGYDYEDVSSKIYDYLFSPTGVINNSEVDKIFCFYVAELDEVWIFIPTGTNTYCDTLLRFDQGDDSWFIRSFANVFLGFGFLESLAGRTWQQATETWASDTKTWLSRSTQPEAPLTLLCDPINKQVYVYDYISSTDDGTVIPWTFTTKDFEIVSKFIRLDGVHAEGTGSDILVEASFDRGNSWLTLGTLNFGLSPTHQNVNMQVVSDVMRIRLSGNDPNFFLDWMRLDFFEETPW